jgi:hypothetical protein
MEVKCPIESDISLPSLRGCGGGEAMSFRVMQSLEVTYRMLYMFNKFRLFTVYSFVLKNLGLQCVHRIL